MRGELLL
jgi:hypothetical protein